MVATFELESNAERQSVETDLPADLGLSNARQANARRSCLWPSTCNAILGEDDPNDAVENTIEFLRYWANFNFPKYLLAVDRVQRSVFKKMGRASGNYEYFGGQIENWFLDPAIMALDEYGIPIQVGEKIQTLLDPRGSLDIALARLRTINFDAIALSPFERELVTDAIAHL